MNIQKPQKKIKKNNPKRKDSKISDIPFDQRFLIHRETLFPPCFVRQNQQKTNFFLRGDFRPLTNIMFNFETTSFQHFSPRMPNLYKFWTSNFGKWGQNRPQNLVHEKGTTHKHTNRQTDRQTSRLLDLIVPVGRFDEQIPDTTDIESLGVC